MGKEKNMETPINELFVTHLNIIPGEVESIFNPPQTLEKEKEKHSIFIQPRYFNDESLKEQLP